MSATAFTFRKDRFDRYLNMACSVWKKQGTGQTDGYGQEQDPVFVKLADDVACYVEAQTGKELNVPPAPPSETSLGVAQYLVFMRPLQVDDPPIDLNNTHYLTIKRPDTATLDPNDPVSGAVMHNVYFVDNPGYLNHHFEVFTTVVGNKSSAF